MTVRAFEAGLVRELESRGWMVRTRTRDRDLRAMYGAGPVRFKWSVPSPRRKYGGMMYSTGQRLLPYGVAPVLRFLQRKVVSAAGGDGFCLEDSEWPDIWDLNGPAVNLAAAARFGEVAPREHFFRDLRGNWCGFDWHSVTEFFVCKEDAGSDASVIADRVTGMARGALSRVQSVETLVDSLLSAAELVAAARREAVRPNLNQLGADQILGSRQALKWGVLYALVVSARVHGWTARGRDVIDRWRVLHPGSAQRASSEEFQRTVLIPPYASSPGYPCDWSVGALVDLIDTAVEAEGLLSHRSSEQSDGPDGR